MDDISNRILDAAMDVFSKKGYEGATTRKIAQEASVNEVTLFRKFHSKENILKTVIEQNQRESIQTIDSILLMEKSTQVQECLLTLGMNIMEFLDERMDFIIMLIAEGRKRPEIAHNLASFLKKILKHLSEYFKEQIEKKTIRNVDPDVAAFNYLSYLFYSTFSKKIYNESVLDDPETKFKSFIDMFLRGTQNLENPKQNENFLNKEEFLKRSKFRGV